MKGVFCQREHHRFLRISPTHSSVFFLIFCVLAKKCQEVFLVGFFGKNEDLRKCPNGIDDQEPFCNLLIVAESTSTRDPVQLDDCYRGPTDIYLRLDPPRRVLGFEYWDNDHVPSDPLKRSKFSWLTVGLTSFWANNYGKPFIKEIIFIKGIIYHGQHFHYRMLGLGAHYKPSKPYDFIVPCDVVQKQIVAVEFCKAIRSNQKNQNRSL